MKYLDKKKSDNQLLDTVKVIWDHPLGKTAVAVGVTFGLLYLGGLAFRALAYTTRVYKEFTSALKS